MGLQKFKSDYRAIIDNVAQLLGAPVRPLQMEWDIERLLTRRLRRVGRAGFGGAEPLVWLETSRPGHCVSVGIQTYRLDLEDRECAVAQVLVPGRVDVPGFWATPVHDYRPLYRFIRTLVRQSHHACGEPYMDQADRECLWRNTIGFLRRDHGALKRFNVPLRRGVLLIGEPGNGKTMACRWLSSQCARWGLEFTTVTSDDFDTARRDGDLHELFQPSRPGIVQFDDLDAALRDRRNNDNARDQSTFLAELDGINSRTGVVYLFTSNLRFDELDPAMRRPGRIDTVIRFPKPDEGLRGRYVREYWQSDLVSRLDIEQVVRETEQFSYAELEEIRKLLALRLLDDGSVDWQWARETFEGRGREVSRRCIGFVTPSPLDCDEAAVTVARRTE